MKNLKNFASLLILFLLLNSATTLLAQKRNIYVSLSNTKELSSYYENYISALDAGVVFGIGNYIYAGGGVTVAKVWEKGYSSLGAGIGSDLQFHLIKRTKFRLILERKGRVMDLFPEISWSGA